MLATMCYMSTRKTLDVDAIGKRAFKRREELHLEQSEVATKAGMSRAYVSRLENGGVMNPKVSDLAAIACALDLSLDRLIYGSARPEPDADIAQVLIARFGPRIGGALVRIDRIAALMEQDDTVALDVVIRNTARKYEPAHSN